MTPVIAPLEVEQAEILVRETGLREVFATMNLFRTSLRQPGVAKVWSTVVEELVVGGTLDPRLRELVILRVAWVSSGSYEWSNHYAHSIRLGMSNEEIVAVREWEHSSLFSDSDRTVLTFVDTVLAGRKLSAAGVLKLKEIAGFEGALMELLILPGIYYALSTLTDSLDMDLDEGVGPWMPDGVAPPSVATPECVEAGG